MHITVLADNLPGPDDLAVGTDGSFYMSDVVEGTIKRFTATGQRQVVVSGLSEPEGIVILPDGSLLIAEQGKNRLVRYNPQDRSVRSFLNLKNNTRQAGLDGIALDRQTSPVATLIVPDSPNGTVLRVTLDGQSITEVARGFLRPTSVWAEADGGLLVTDENGGALSRIHTDGTVERVASLSIPDDVVEDSAGNIFVTTLGDGAVHLIAAGSGLDSILVSGLSSPQGLVLDVDENLIVTDPGHHRLIKISH
jgi:sugar lactone lactonase YvrE